MTDFNDVLEANARYAATFDRGDLRPHAARGLAILTCMDSRIDPLSALGLSAGDAKILRNAGARVTEDVLRTLVLAVHLLGVDRILVMPHTNCRMAQGSEEDIHAVILERSGMDTRSLEFRTQPDQHASLTQDLVRVRAYPLIPSDVLVGGAIYDVHTGLLEPWDLG